MVCRKPARVASIRFSLSCVYADSSTSKKAMRTELHDRLCTADGGRAIGSSVEVGGQGWLSVKKVLDFLIGKTKLPKDTQDVNRR